MHTHVDKHTHTHKHILYTHPQTAVKGRLLGMSVRRTEADTDWFSFHCLWLLMKV